MSIRSLRAKQIGACSIRAFLILEELAKDKSVHDCLSILTGSVMCGKVAAG